MAVMGGRQSAVVALPTYSTWRANLLLITGSYHEEVEEATRSMASS